MGARTGHRNSGITQTLPACSEGEGSPQGNPALSQPPQKTICLRLQRDDDLHHTSAVRPPATWSWRPAFHAGEGGSHVTNDVVAPGGEPGATDLCDQSCSERETLA